MEGTFSVYDVETLDYSWARCGIFLQYHTSWFHGKSRHQCQVLGGSWIQCERRLGNDRPTSWRFMLLSACVSITSNQLNRTLRQNRNFTKWDFRIIHLSTKSFTSSFSSILTFGPIGAIAGTWVILFGIINLWYECTLFLHSYLLATNMWCIKNWKKCSYSRRWMMREMTDNGLPVREFAASISWRD